MRGYNTGCIDNTEAAYGCLRVLLRFLHVPPGSLRATLATTLFLLVAMPAALAGQVTVVDGSGDGVYAAGARVFIQASPAPGLVATDANLEPADPQASMPVFDQWQGQTELLEDPFSANTSLLAPEGDLEFRASFKQAPRWTIPAVLSYVPENHSGVIFLFHGAQTCNACLVTRLNIINFIRDANARGYAVVVPEKRDASSDAWDQTTDATQNPDMLRTAAIRQDLVARGHLTDSDAVYLVGISAGGMFASLFDDTAQQQLDFPVVATALVVSPGDGTVLRGTQVPTLFAMAENDSLVPMNLGVTSYQNLLSRGVETQLLVASPFPVGPDFFWSVPGMSAEDSRSVVDQFKAAGVLDAQGYILQNPRYSGWEKSLPTAFTRYDTVSDVRDLLLAAYAEHGYWTAFNSGVFTFFDNPALAVKPAPQIDSMTPALGPVGTWITISGSNLAQIESVSFSGVTASFTPVSPSQVKALVPLAATSGLISVKNSAGIAVSPTQFTVAASGPLVVDLMSPLRVKVGDQVTIYGKNVHKANKVSLGSELNANFKVLSTTNMVFTVPVNAPRSSQVVVNSADGSVVAGTLWVR